MSRPANEIYEAVRRNRIKLKDSSYRKLKEKAVEAVTQMMKDGELETEIKLTDDDMKGLIPVTREMRNLGYYYCLIETQDVDGDIEGHRLRISIAHLEKANEEEGTDD